MKKIFISLLILSINASAQNLDTVLIREGLIMQSQDWAYLIGSYNDTNSDSATAQEVRRIRDHIRAVNPATWATSVTVDSIQGTFAMFFYRAVKTSSAGEIVQRYTAITGAIEAKTTLSTFIAGFNSALLADFNRKRDRGKSIVMNN